MNKSLRIVDVGADVRVGSDQFEYVLVGEDDLEHGDGRTVRNGFHRGGQRLVCVGDFLVAQVVRVLDVVVQLTL